METIDVKTIRLYLESDDVGRMNIERLWPEITWSDLKMVMLKNMGEFLLSNMKNGEAVTNFQFDGKIIEVTAKIILGNA